jgi:predicted nicotinamide N-methyase
LVACVLGVPTCATAKWDAANLNESGADPIQNVYRGRVVISVTKAAQIVAPVATAIGALPIVPVEVDVSVTTSAGVPVAVDGTFSVVGQMLVYTGIGGTDPVATDIVHWTAN